MAKDQRKTGPTPAGGDESSVTYIGADGAPTDNADKAVSAVVREYAAGVEIARTYLGKDTGRAAVKASVPQWTDPGEVTTDGDWYEDAKNTWDVWWTDDDGIYHKATTLPQFLRAMGWDGAEEPAQRQLLGNAMTWSSWQSAPQQLRDEVRAWLVQSRPGKAT